MFLKKSRLIIAGLFLALCSCGNGVQRIGVVDLPSLYASFDYQKELDAEFQNFDEELRIEKDSLTRGIQMFEFTLAQANDYADDEKNILFERSYNDYLAQQQYLDYVRDSVAKSYSEKVWTQLNSYLQDYGSENGYDVIIGMKGDGNVMYASEAANITKDVIEYVNKKYQGE